jgi:hypothetical protein
VRTLIRRLHHRPEAHFLEEQLMSTTLNSTLVAELTDQAEDAIRAAYGPNYDRLVEVKRRYGPGNVFHLNHNIAP